MSNSLTVEQELLMLTIRDEWFEVPFSTSSIDKQKAEAAINLTYDTVGENKPKEIIWFDKPLDAVIWMIDNNRTNKYRLFCLFSRCRRLCFYWFY